MTILKKKDKVIVVYCVLIGNGLRLVVLAEEKRAGFSPLSTDMEWTYILLSEAHPDYFICFLFFFESITLRERRISGFYLKKSFNMFRPNLE